MERIACEARVYPLHAMSTAERYALLLRMCEAATAQGNILQIVERMYALRGIVAQLRGTR